MNIVKIELGLPDIVKEIYGKMEELAKGRYFCIAGGAISNTYMNLPIRDIDVFFSFETTVEEVEHVFGIKMQSQYRWDPNFDYQGIEIPFLFRFEYKGMKVEIIQVEKERVIEFDLRFRQFYYYKGEVLTTKEALEDIKNKEIVVVNPSTPISTFFRLHRFKESLGFSINEKSLQYTLWSFNQVPLKLERAIGYVEKNEHKISPELKEYLIHLFQNNTQEYENPYEELQTVITFKDALYPYHKETEKLVHYEMKKPHACMAIHHTALETFKGSMEKKLKLSVPYKYYETRFGTFLNTLKKYRTRYLVSEYQAATPYPYVKKEEMKSRFKEFLNTSFMRRLGSQLKNTGDSETWRYGTFLYNIHEIPENITVFISSLGLTQSVFTYGDVLNENVAIMTIKTSQKRELNYFIRKCDNGKYTISGVAEQSPDGSGFYLQIIGEALKEQYGEMFDFYNSDVKGLYSHAYKNDYNLEYYFTAPTANADLLDHKTIMHYVPFKIPVKEAV